MFNLVIEECLICLLFYFFIRMGTGDNGLNCIYFYPEEFQEEAIRRKLVTPEQIIARKKSFYMPFVVTVVILYVLLVVFVNQANTFKEIFFESLFLSECMNIFDGIVIDHIYVVKDPVFHIPGMEDVPYEQSLSFSLKKRILTAISMAVMSLIFTGIVLLIQMVI